jgi:hypothetical protein
MRHEVMAVQVPSGCCAKAGEEGKDLSRPALGYTIVRYVHGTCTHVATLIIPSVLLACKQQVDATFQFTHDVFPASTWGANVTDTAYRLGFAFGSHFGPGRAPSNVSLDAVEFGNEPWIGYNASFYSQVSSRVQRSMRLPAINHATLCGD